MKSSINFLLLLLTSPLIAQIAFEGAPNRLDSINSVRGQNYLIIHPTRNQLTYTEEQGGNPSTSDLFKKENAIINDNEWEIMVFMDFLGEKGMRSPIGFVGSQLLYNEVKFDKGVYTGSVKSLDGGRSQEVIIPFLKNKAPIQSGCLSNDGQYMILSLESNNSYGVEDLYVVKRSANGEWSSPKNLGYMINTEFQEITPFLAADNKTLFFATNGRGGEGSFDLFYSVRQDDSWRNWSSPVNLGNKVNSGGAETSFVFQSNSNVAYFVSSQDSDGYGDIFSIKIKEDIPVDTTRALTISGEKPEEQVEVEVPSEESRPYVLRIVDAKSNAPILQASLISSTDTIQTINGFFSMDSLNEMEVEIKSAGFLPKVLMLDERLQPGENLIPLNSIAKGSIVTLEHVLFHRGTANMIEGSEKELDLVVEVMNDNPSIKILLKGHTDNTGDPVKNVQLSEERVKTVKAYLISKGINAFRVTGRGYGGNEPIASNATEETRKQNRRVEFEVVEN